jgi:hypothetical protein
MAYENLTPAALAARVRAARRALDTNGRHERGADEPAAPTPAA